ncbi:hypothetical protein DPMN_026820 [Dreissena polymorpha]|uniref:Uncharacterized protein n=1 Tax=Dreissena polymorpha TaxID=45954 RepID=A0A9D4REZ1_DREPO|nr:hypothetical protein DPMN_026820 [Dreissena polymorpha]
MGGFQKENDKELHLAPSTATATYVASRPGMCSLLSPAGHKTIQVSYTQFMKERNWEKTFSQTEAGFCNILY